MSAIPSLLQPSSPLPLAIFAEHPTWLRPLYAALDRRGVAWEEISAIDPSYDPACDGASRYRAVLNRMSPSAWERGRGDAVLSTAGYLERLEAYGVPVLNGVSAWNLEIDKGAQIELLDRLGIAAPRTRVANCPGQLLLAADGLEYPILVKPNNGGNGAGIRRFHTRDELAAAVEAETFTAGVDGRYLVQEYHAPIGRSVVRAETLGGRFLYAVKVHFGGGDGFSLCLADVCSLEDRGAGGERFAAVDPERGVAVSSYAPTAEEIGEIETVARGAGLDLGGVEYLTSERDGRRYVYDINALSNFVAEPEAVLGFDPHDRVAEYLAVKNQLVAVA